MDEQNVKIDNTKYCPLCGAHLDSSGDCTNPGCPKYEKNPNAELFGEE